MRFDHENSAERDSRVSPHNKRNMDWLRIRQSWVAVVLVFIVIGMAAIYILSRR